MGDEQNRNRRDHDGRRATDSTSCLSQPPTRRTTVTTSVMTVAWMAMFPRLPMPPSRNCRSSMALSGLGLATATTTRALRLPTASRPDRSHRRCSSGVPARTPTPRAPCETSARQNAVHWASFLMIRARLALYPASNSLEHPNLALGRLIGSDTAKPPGQSGHVRSD